MFNVHQVSPVPEEWAKRAVRASGWPEDRTLNLFLGSDPDGTESGSTVWYGHRAVHGKPNGWWSFGEWDVTVILTSRATELFGTYPEYVAWILGHEFIQDVIKRVSGSAIREYFDLPHEVAADRFGRWVVGPEVFVDAIQRLRDDPSSPMGKERLGRVLADKTVDHIPDTIPELRKLVEPFQAGLVRLWRADQEKGEASYVVDIDPSVLFGEDSSQPEVTA